MNQSSAVRKKFLDTKSWNKRNDPNEKGAIFSNWLDSVEVEIYYDELLKLLSLHLTESYTMGKLC
jgi:hypothetical protein